MKKDKRGIYVMYQKLLTLSVFAICSYTDVRYRRIYGWSLVLYGILAAGGHIVEKIVAVGTDTGLINGNPLSGAAELAIDLVIGSLPGLFCIVVSWISRQALGYGDSVLIAVSGVSLGVAACLQLLLTAFFFAGVFGLILLVFFRKGRRYDMPFVPFLFLGMILAGGG